MALSAVGRMFVCMRVCWNIDRRTCTSRPVSIDQVYLQGLECQTRDCKQWNQGRFGIKGRGFVCSYTVTQNMVQRNAPILASRPSQIKPVLTQMSEQARLNKCKLHKVHLSSCISSSFTINTNIHYSCPLLNTLLMAVINLVSVYYFYIQFLLSINRELSSVRNGFPHFLLEFNCGSVNHFFILVNLPLVW